MDAKEAKGLNGREGTFIATPTLAAKMRQMRLPALLLCVMLIVASITGSLSDGSDDQSTPILATASRVTISTQAMDENHTFEFDEQFEEFVTYGELTAMVHSLAENYPEIVRLYNPVTLTQYGGSWQGRDIWVLKISDGVADEPEYYNDPEEEDVVIIGNHHASEWMTFEVPLYLAHFLTTFYGQPALDNDGDGRINEDPIDGFDNDWDGEDDDGDNDTMPRFDGIDNDEDGIIDEGIDEDPNEGRVSYLVDNREIWILPMLNPDGYEFDREGAPGYTIGDSWRKNTRDNDGDNEFDPDVDGVDLNRNYVYEWNHNEDSGTVDEDGFEAGLDDRIWASPVYHGPDDQEDDDGDEVINLPGCNPGNNCNEDPVNGYDDDSDSLVDEDKDGGFSEPETMAVEELFKKLDIYYDDTVVPVEAGDYRPENHDRKSNAVATISYHNSGEWVIWPWGYTNDPTPHQGLHEFVGHELMDMTGYEDWRAAGNYQTSGDYMDWTYGSHGLLSFTLELNRGNGGRVAENIIPTGRAMLAPNLYITEKADSIKIALEGTYPDLNVSSPKVVHEQPHTKFYENDNYLLKVSVENRTNLIRDSVTLNYRVNNGPWHTKPMKIDGDDPNVYHGKIPSVDAPATVEYYFSLMDTRDVNIESPHDGPFGGAFVYEVDAVVGFGEAWKDALAVGFMMIIMYGAVWGGLYYFVGVATEADRRKLNPEDAHLWDD